MSYAIPAIDYETAVVNDTPRDLIFIPRSRMQWLPFIVPLFLCGLSWAGNGVPFFTDAGFLLFTILCGVFLMMEFIRFPRRFGIGGLILYGGTLCWFCQDYFTHWFNHDFSVTGAGLDMPPWVVAKAAFLHVLFVMLMAVGLNWHTGRWLEKMILYVPDPGDERFYLVVVLTMFMFSICPNFLFNAEPWYLCIYHSLFSGWTGPPLLTVYRDGNLNYSWGGYVAQLMQVGETGGIVAIIYTILIAKTWPTRLLGILIWSYNAMLAFETGRRGEICFSLLPPIAVLFIKYQARAAMMFKRFSLKSFLICGIMTLMMQVVVQFQGTFRGMGYANASYEQLELFKNQGNTMFSEGLMAYEVVGVDMPFFYARDFPGEGALRAIPQTAFDAVVGIIPRALWHDKPVDSLWAWYNQYYTGVGNGVSGTTISHGLIGSWYFKYGLIGMMEGAVLVGWLIGTSERALQHSDGKPVSILMSLGFATWIFRDFRDFIFIDLYGLVLGAVALCIMVPLMRPILGGGSQTQLPSL